MELYIRRRRLPYVEANRIYGAKITLSRTYVDGVRAVNLHTCLRGMEGVVLRKVADDLIFYFDGRPIVKLTYDGYTQLLDLPVGITEHNRFDLLTGLVLFTTDAKSYISQNKTRAVVKDQYEREGTAPGYVRRSVPMFVGIRFNSETGAIHPEDIHRIPSDRRSFYEIPSPGAKKDFAELWKQVREIMMFDIHMQSYTDDCINNNRIGPTDREGWVSADALAKSISDGTYTPKLLECALRTKAARYLWADQRNTETVQRMLVQAIPGLQKAALVEYAKQTGDRFVTKGGQLLGNGWYVAEKDKQEVK